MTNARPWWWKLPEWFPGMEARRLEYLELQNLLEREGVNEQLRKIDQVLHSDDPSDRDYARQTNVRADRVDLEHHRTAILDTERTLATRRQNLLLKTTAHATWAAAFVGGVSILLSLPPVRRWLGLP